MRDYNRNDRGGGRGGRRFGGRDSGRRSFGGRDSGRREMHHATCAQCGKDCEVPFRPSEDRPVYCSNCFEQRRNEDGNSRESGGRNFGRPKFEERRSYSSGGDRGNTRGNDNGQLTEQLKILNIKLDKILRILEPKITQPPVPKKEVTVFDVEPKEEKSITVKNEKTDIVLQPKIAKTKTSKKKVKEEKV